MCKREVLIIGDGTTISAWSYQPREGLGGCTTNSPFFLGYFKKLSYKPALGMKPATSRSIKQHSNSRATSAFG